jgi:CheY-like chemotaxis protein
VKTMMSATHSDSNPLSPAPITIAPLELHQLLRTPMNAIVGMTGLLSNTTLTDEQRTYIQTIRRSANDLIDSIDRLTHAEPAAASRASATFAYLIDTSFAESHPCRILIVEDNAINQMVLSAVLQKMGYTPELCSDGKQALQKLHEKKYDLIFMDIQMPEMDGITATKAIRHTPDLNLPPPTIVALTANATREDKEVALKAGMDMYLTKPVKFKDIEHAVERSEKLAAQFTHSDLHTSDYMNEPLLDTETVAALKSLSTPENNLLRDIQAMFLESLDKERGELQQFLASGDAESLWQAAHRLKGASHNVGASRLAAVCKLIEDAAKTTTSAAEVFPILDAVIHDTADAMHKL